MICSVAVSPENDIACLVCLTGSLSLGPTNIGNQAPTFSADNRSGHKIVVFSAFDTIPECVQIDFLLLILGCGLSPVELVHESTVPRSVEPELLHLGD
jgi:hypothetical protein